MINHSTDCSVKAALTNYHCMVKVRAAMDQFLEGLDVVGVVQKPYAACKAFAT